MFFLDFQISLIFFKRSKAFPLL